MQEKWAQKRNEDPRPPQATGSCCECVCMCHRLAETTNWVIGERPEQPESLFKKPRGASSGVLPGWAAKGAIQSPPALLEVRGCNLTGRSLSAGDIQGVENEFEHKGEKKGEKSAQWLPSNCIYEIHCLSMLKEVGFPKAVFLAVYLLLENIRGAFKELPTASGTFWSIWGI